MRVCVCVRRVRVCACGVVDDDWRRLFCCRRTRPSSSRAGPGVRWRRAAMSILNLPLIYCNLSVLTAVLPFHSALTRILDQ